MRQLRRLQLDFTHITDAGLALIAELNTLESLSLVVSAVTQSGHIESGIGFTVAIQIGSDG